MEMLQGVWKQHLRPRAVVGYGVKMFLPSPPNYVTRSPGSPAYFHISEFMQPGRLGKIKRHFKQFLYTREGRSFVGWRPN